MKNLKVGDKLAIHCYKHSGAIDRICDEAIVLEVSDDMLVCANDKARLIENDGRVHHTNESAILFFYKKRWFNVLGQLKKHGLFYYCNIATPFLIDNGIIKYIDYDLDLRVFPDGGFKILDRNEYNYHKKLMKYPDEIDMILKRELSNLIELKKNKQGPFEDGIVEKYYEEYKKIINK